MGKGHLSSQVYDPFWSLSSSMAQFFIPDTSPLFDYSPCVTCAASAGWTSAYSPRGDGYDETYRETSGPDGTVAMNLTGMWLDGTWTNAQLPVCKSGLGHRNVMHDTTSMAEGGSRGATYLPSLLVDTSSPFSLKLGWTSCDSLVYPERQQIQDRE